MRQSVLAHGARGVMRSSFFALCLNNGRELRRNPSTGFAALFMFGFFLLLSFVMQAGFSLNQTAPTVAVRAAASTDAMSTVRALALRGIAVSEVAAASADPGATIVVELMGEHARVVVDTGGRVAWSGVWHALRGEGFAASEIAVVDSEGDVKVDFVQVSLGTSLALGLMAIVFTGIAVPLVSMRERGTLRLLGTTPLRRHTLLLSHLPIALALGAVECAVVVAVSSVRNYVDALDVMSIGTTTVVGVIMLLAFGSLLAARSRNAEASQQISVMLPILLVMPAGGMVPVYFLPDFILALFNALPTTWLIASLNADLAGAKPFLPVPLLWLLMLGAAAVAFFFAARRFEWDQSERGPVRHPARRIMNGVHNER